jgi:hypothetical protein
MVAISIGAERNATRTTEGATGARGGGQRTTKETAVTDGVTRACRPLTEVGSQKVSYWALE